MFFTLVVKAKKSKKHGLPPGKVAGDLQKEANENKAEVKNKENTDQNTDKTEAATETTN